MTLFRSTLYRLIYLGASNNTFDGIEMFVRCNSDDDVAAMRRDFPAYGPHGGWVASAVTERTPQEALEFKTQLARGSVAPAPQRKEASHVVA